jgi:death-on-curing family protein
MFAKTKKWLETEQFIYEEINEIRYPTIETIITIHDYLIEAFIAEGETVHRGLISDAALSFHGIQAYQDENENKKEDIILKGALIFNQFLQAGHPFVDGNKRTGFITLWLFLMLNGFRLRVSSWAYKKHLKQINKWAMEIDSDNSGEIVQWIKQNVILRNSKKI